ncbi:hypothetical protein ABZ863_25545 [Saccharomonospora sp. NPDC046836]|uniref:hypothetical protein n=1 Tax=Saccharomonospora sp. NPDC046836 TaxID=3156921 RepID=UPI0033EE6378
MTVQPDQPSGVSAEVEAARLLLLRMGLSPEDLLAVPVARPPVPTFAEYVPVVSAAVSERDRGQPL